MAYVFLESLHGLLLRDADSPTSIGIVCFLTSSMSTICLRTPKKENTY